MDRLFFDTNVLLDVLEQRTPWFPEAFACLQRVESGEALGSLSAISLSDIAYIQRGSPPHLLYAAFRKLRNILDVAPLASESIDAALARALPDFEDGLQYEAARHWNATHLLTRNVKDFPALPGMAVLSPAAYLQQRAP
jgi:predicted nucleic acid-binding protein